MTDLTRAFADAFPCAFAAAFCFCDAATTDLVRAFAGDFGAFGWDLDLRGLTIPHPTARCLAVG